MSKSVVVLVGVLWPFSSIINAQDLLGKPRDPVADLRSHVQRLTGEEPATADIFITRRGKLMILGSARIRSSARSPAPAIPLSNANHSGRTSAPTAATLSLGEEGVGARVYVDRINVERAAPWSRA